jgi:hypothetical protein
MSKKTDTAPNPLLPAGGSTVVGHPGYTEPKPMSDEQVTAKGRVAVISTPPALLPPGAAGAEAALAAASEAVTATWRSGVMVSAMWSINETRNAWMYVQTVGWRKIYNGRDGAFEALVTLAAQARQTGRAITFREEADGMVYEIYLW